MNIGEPNYQSRYYAKYVILSPMALLSGVKGGLRPPHQPIKSKDGTVHRDHRSNAVNLVTVLMIRQQYKHDHFDIDK